MGRWGDLGGVGPGPTPSSRGREDLGLQPGCPSGKATDQNQADPQHGVIESFNNYFPKLKGNTRRIIYDDKIKREDVSEYDLKNSEISEILKTNRVLNEVNENDSQYHVVSQSAKQGDDELASLFNTITKESQLIEAEKLLAQGLSVSEVKARMALSSQG